LKDGHFARRTCQFSIAKTMGIFRLEILLSFIFSLACRKMGWVLSSCGFHFPLSSFFSQDIYRICCWPPKSSAPPVFLGLGRSEFDTKSNSTRAIYIYMSSRAGKQQTGNFFIEFASIQSAEILKLCRKSLCRPPFFLLFFFWTVTIRDWWKSYYNNFCKKSVVSYLGIYCFRLCFFFFFFFLMFFGPPWVCLFVCTCSVWTLNITIIILLTIRFPNQSINNYYYSVWQIIIIIFCACFSGCYRNCQCRLITN
jgi:hypothetical protein